MKKSLILILLGVVLFLENGCKEHIYAYDTAWDIYLGEWENTQIAEIKGGYTYIQLSADASYKYQLQGQKNRKLTVKGNYRVEGDKLRFLTVADTYGGESKKMLTITKQPYTDSLGQIHLHLNDIDYVKK